MLRDLQQRIFLLLLLTSAVTLPGCDLLGDDDDDEQPVTTGVYVTNQGVFGSGPFGSVTVYDPATGQTSTIQAGNFNAQSAEIFDDRLYVTGGGALATYDLEAQSWLPDIPTGFTASRYTAFASNRAYVTDLYANHVSVFDLTAMAKVRHIPVGVNPEGVAAVGSRVYVANSGFGAGRTVSFIDARTDEVVQTVDVACDGPRSVFADEQGEVWVVCTGNTVYDANFNVVSRTNGAVVLLNGAGQVVRRFDDIGAQIGAASLGQAASYSPEAQELYVIRAGNSILRFNTATNTRAGEIGPVAGGDIGAVGYDAASERLYVGHVTSYTASGTVTIHDRAGAQVGQFTAGIIPTYITFRRQAAD